MERGGLGMKICKVYMYICSTWSLPASLKPYMLHDAGQVIIMILSFGLHKILNRSKKVDKYCSPNSS